MFELYFDLGEERFLSKADLEEMEAPPTLWSNVRPGSFKLSTLFDPSEFHRHLQRCEEKHYDLITSLQNKFQNYEVPVVTVKERSKEEVGTIFERINNTATNLSTLDLMIAWTWGDDFDLRDEIRQILTDLDEKGFGGIPEKRILQCLSAIICKTTSTKAILDLDVISVRNNIDKLRTSLEQAVDYLSTEFLVQTSDFLPHSHQLVPLTFLFSRGGISSTGLNDAIRHWFWTTSFSKRYAGSTDSHMDEDISLFSEMLDRPARVSAITRYSHRISRTDLIEREFSIARPFTRAFLLLLAQKRPKSLLTGKYIDIGRSLSSYNRKEYHHIFPKDYLRKKGKGKINSLCNFCFLPASTNKRITSHPPSKYLYDFQLEMFDHATSDQQRKASLEAILESNLMPVDDDIYLHDHYSRFLEDRATVVLKFLESQLFIEED